MRCIRCISTVFSCSLPRPSSRESMAFAKPWHLRFSQRFRRESHGSSFSVQLFLRLEDICTMLLTAPNIWGSCKADDQEHLNMFRKGITKRLLIEEGWCPQPDFLQSPKPCGGPQAMRARYWQTGFNSATLLSSPRVFAFCLSTE